MKLHRIAAFFICLLSLVGAKAQINAEQVLNIGRNVLSMDDYMLSIHYFNLAAEAKPYLAEPYYFRALAKLMLDDYRGAEADASMALDRNKFMTEAYRVRGFARLQLHRDSLAPPLGAAGGQRRRDLAVAPGQRAGRQSEGRVDRLHGLLLRRPLCHLPPAHRQSGDHGAAAEQAVSWNGSHPTDLQNL